VDVLVATALSGVAVSGLFLIGYGTFRFIGEFRASPTASSVSWRAA
jgi:prolipoprotein diacylglyceryltransferase